MPRTKQTTKVHVTIRTRSGELTVETGVPAGDCSAMDLLPALRSIDDALVGEAERASEASGRSISCRAGCGVCCRQVVPLTEVEAGWLMALVASLSVDRQNAIRSRFRRATATLSGAGLLQRVMEGSSLIDGQLRALAAEYFRLGISCPFLENERCTIHPVRPLACREYLVTSPPEACAGAGRVDRVPVPGRLSQRLERDESGRVEWIPLVLAPQWMEGRADRGRARRMPGPELLEKMLSISR